MLSEIKGKKAGKGQDDKKGGGKAKPSSVPFKAGETIYQIEDYRPDVACSPRLLKLTVKSVKDGVLVCGKKRVRITDALTLDAAKEAWKARIDSLIGAPEDGEDGPGHRDGRTKRRDGRGHSQP